MVGNVLMMNGKAMQVFMKTQHRTARPYALFPSDGEQQPMTFRYLILRVDSICSGNCLQFSHLELKDKFGRVFDWQANCPSRSYEVVGSYRYIAVEPPSRAYDPYPYSSTSHASTGKVCMEDITSAGVTIIYDLGTDDVLDAKKWKFWSWRYSNDTWARDIDGNGARNMKKFSLWLSKDRDSSNWILVDSQEDYSSKYVRYSTASEGDGQIGYQGKIRLQQQ